MGISGLFESQKSHASPIFSPNGGTNGSTKTDPASRLPGMAHTDDGGCSSQPSTEVAVANAVPNLPKPVASDCCVFILVGQAVNVYWFLKKGKSYFGITNNLARRSLEHGLRGARELPRLATLGSRNAARGVEQWLINFGRENGFALQNAINGIAPNNPIYNSSIETGMSEAEQNEPGFMQTIVGVFRAAPGLIESLLEALPPI
jgi:hypothetical protein